MPTIPFDYEVATSKGEEKKRPRVLTAFMSHPKDNLQSTTFPWNKNSVIESQTSTCHYCQLGNYVTHIVLWFSIKKKNSKECIYQNTNRETSNSRRSSPTQQAMDNTNIKRINNSKNHTNTSTTNQQYE